jgi:acetamidase/formamidase
MTQGEKTVSKHHYLPATPETVAWGYFDAARKPVLEIDSGDTITVDTIPAGEINDVPPDASRIRPDHKLLLDTAPRGPGPHPVNGPVYVKGAEIGDVLQIDILDIKPNQDWGFSAIMPLLGTLPEEFTDYETVIIDMDAAKNTANLPWGTELPLAPFFGVMAVAPPPAWGRQTTVIPRAFGGNMDNKALCVGTTLYLPVFNKGALFSVGDGHGVQGDGEVCITALETGLTGTLRLTVRKDMSLKGPLAESATHLISIGTDEDLDDAAKIAVREMVRELCLRTNLSRNQAYILCSLAGDLKVTQTVDVHKGCHMMLPKAAFSTAS